MFTFSCEFCREKLNKYTNIVKIKMKKNHCTYTLGDDQNDDYNFNCFSVTHKIGRTGKKRIQLVYIEHRTQRDRTYAITVAK